MSQSTLARSPKSSSKHCAARFNDLTFNLAEPLGGLDNLNEVERTMVRSAAALVLRLEQLQAALTAGETVNPDLLVRLNSEARRALTVLRRRIGTHTKFNAADPLTNIKSWVDAP